MAVKPKTTKAKVELPPFEYPQGYQLVAGVDEVGRGPLVGDVVTAAVILDPNNPIEGLNDSKKLSEKKTPCTAARNQRESIGMGGRPLFS